MAALLRHASRYSIGGLLTVAASLVSFPILTRLLSVEEYGAMSTVAVALTLLVALGKLGMQRAILRFFHAEGGGDRRSSAGAALVATSVLGGGGVGIVVMLVWLAFVEFAPPSWIGTRRIVDLMQLAAALVAIRVLDSMFQNLLYAEERSKALSVYSVVKRYATLVAVIGAVWLLARDAAGVFGATIVAELASLAALAWYMLRDAPLRPQAFSQSLFGRMVAFGAPMVGVEMAWSILSVGDRYVIQHLMGSEAVGIYSAAYNLCDYVKLATVVALASAVAPSYQRIWEREGRGATERFLGVYARGYMAFALFVAAVVTVSALPLVTTAASAKYASATVIVPWVMLGMAMESYVGIATAGLILQKRTASIFAMVAVASVLNIALNYLLVPLLGLMGAAVATLVAFAALMGMAIAYGRRTLDVPFPWVTVVSGGLAFAAAVLLGDLIETPWHALDLVLRSAAALLVYWPVLLSLDPRLRSDLSRYLPAIRARLHGTA